MLNCREFLQKLTPVEVEGINSYIYNIYHEKVTSKTTNYENLVDSVDRCPVCGSKRIVKNGFNPHHKQKYLCKDCHAVFLPTTNTLFQHSHVSYETWITFIADEINGLTLAQEVVSTGLSKTTCFNMRHKLYKAISDYQDSVQLKGLIELDPTYEKINLKGTKPDNMPRISKPRGKKKPGKSKSLRGINHHKICIVTAIDSDDRILFKIAGLGGESKELLEPFSEHFTKGSEVVMDSKSSLESFTIDHGMTPDIIPSDKFKSPNGHTLSSVNQLHQSLSELIRVKHGVSTRHLQGYLDWLVFTKELHYKTEAKRQKIEAYMYVMKKIITVTTRNICKQPLPIDLEEAYGEYHYGIFSHNQLFA